MNRGVVGPDGRRPTAVGSYIFAGGFTLGIKEHFDVLCHLEETNYGVATMRHNQPEIPVYVGPDTWPLDDLAARGVDLVYGNPPCAPWSVCGGAKGEAWSKDPRLSYTLRHFDTWRRLKPTFWVTESVALALKRGRSFWDTLARECLEAGYSVTYLLHNAMYCGTPQNRPRFLFVAHRVELSELNYRAHVLRTIDEALSEIVEPGEPLEHNIRRLRKQGVIKNWKPGLNARSAWELTFPPDVRRLNARGQVIGRPAFTIKRARSGQPAPVVMHELVHPTEDRGLSLKELAVLCGYPQDYVWINAKDAGQIGRGVCTQVGGWLACQLITALATPRVVVEPRLVVADLSTLKHHTRLQSWPEPVFEQRVSREEPARVVHAAISPMQPCLLLPTPTPTPTPAPAPAPTPCDALPRPLPDEGSGKFIRRLLQLDGYSDTDLVALVHANYANRKTTTKDVAWNRARLRLTNAATPEVQPKRTQERHSNDPSRQVDLSSLRANAHGRWVHRDYGAHFFRWGFAGRYVDGKTEVLDVGCGTDCAMIDILTHPRNVVPKRYIGVDLNRKPHKTPSRQWATLLWEFDFLARYAELGQFDRVVCFEVLEHLYQPDGLQLLAGLRACLKPAGKLLLSTPVFNGKAAANHLHEWGVKELEAALSDTGLLTMTRFGTFASLNELNHVIEPAHREVLDRLAAYYSNEVLSCFLAPLYPNASRNNLWVVRRAE